MAYLWAIDCAAGPEEGTMFTCTMIAPGIAYGPAVIWVTAGEFFRRQQIIRGVTWADAHDVARGVLRERRAKDVAAYLEKMMESRFPRMMSIYGSEGSPMAPASEPEHLIPAADESPGVLRGDRKEPVEAGISYV